jgi:hypothetical protein
VELLVRWMPCMLKGLPDELDVLHVERNS